MNSKTSDSSEDDFFGNQSDDEDSACKVPLAHGSLLKHESQAQEENYRNIGYHEAYDENKEIKLQEGFEAGYRDTMEDARKLGALLGNIVMCPTRGDASVAVSVVRDYLEKAQSLEKEKSKASSMQNDRIHEVTAHLEQMVCERNNYDA
mmetsp:Transcript_2221/g.3380  ORF Transcript_2221/g.3380 Transcript_2221/m.3380 type:complete len:149 (-) Transcript_2221:20-466(-)